MRMTCTTALLIGWFTAFHAAAQENDAPAQENNPQRQIGQQDRRAELVAQLLADDQFPDAIAICRQAASDHAPISDAAADWAIRWSQVLTAQAQVGDAFDDRVTVRAAQPVQQLIDAYPDHPRALFLKVQLAQVRAAAAVRAVVVASISADPQVRDQAAARLLKVTTEFQQLDAEIDRARAQLDQSRVANRRLDAELNRLKQQVNVGIVSHTLMQTELVPRGTDDCIAAATTAETAADRAIERIDAGSEARRELQRLKLESVLRADQPDRAAQLAAQYLQPASNKISPAWLALLIRIHSAQGKQPQASRLLDSHFGTDPAASPASLELDLARLDYLLRFDSQSVAPWLDQIQQRGGAYARRRAEAIALSLGRAAAPVTAIEPALLAARGRQSIRGGEISRGVAMLAVAAKAETDSKRAFRNAIEAAAVLSDSKRSVAAAELLIATARAHPTAESAAAIHLQGIFLLAQEDADAVEPALQSQLDQWPLGEQAEAARRWLQELLDNQGRWVEAAVVVSDISPEQITPPRVAAIRAAWRSAFHRLPAEQFPFASRRFHGATQHLRGDSLWQAEYRIIAALLLHRDQLAGLPAAAPGEDPFVGALIQFRIDGQQSPALQSAPDSLVDEAAWRLTRDGRIYPQRRRAIAELLQLWQPDQSESFAAAERLLWAGQSTDAIAMLRKLVDQSDDSAEALQLAAELLQAADQPPTTAEAIRLWDQLASGTPRRSRLWHRARLAAIQLLRQSGQHDEATKRARFVLLTAPELDAEWRSQYEALVR